MIRVASLVGAITLMCASAAHAQSWEIAAMAGYVFPVGLEKQSRDVDAARIGGGFTWQVQAGRMLTPRWGAEIVWSQQFSAYEIESGGNTGDLFKLLLTQLHGNLVYQFAQNAARVQPFAFGGLGATFFSARDLATEAKFSAAVGGGVKAFPWPGVGLRAQLRYRPTWLNDDDAGLFCDPFGFCQSMLRQIEVAGGITFRF